MKSLSVRPLILCVQVVISTFPQARKMSGWCPCSSASSPTRFTNLRASRKSGNLKAFVMWCSSITFHPSTCFCREASSSPLRGGTPPRHETHVLVTRSDITATILALGGAKAGDTDACCGHGVRVCRIRGHTQDLLPQRTGHGPGRFATIQETVVGEAAGLVVCPGRGSFPGASSRGLAGRSD